MYKKILVPMALYRTQASRSAVNVAETLLADGGTITALHVIESLPSMAAAVLPADLATTRRSEVVATLQEQLEGHDNISPEILEGHPGRTITQFAKDNDYDLIVVSSHRPDMLDLLLGSTAAWVVRHADCAVHVTR